MSWRFFKWWKNSECNWRNLSYTLFCVSSSSLSLSLSLSLSSITKHFFLLSCAQCFQPFDGGLFFEFEKRKYCEYDFQLLFAPCCKGCGECIIGRVIKAMNFNWHDRCFKCNLCNLSLADVGFVKNNGR